MKSFESEVKSICENREFAPQAAILRAALKGETWKDLEAAYKAAGGRWGTVSFLSLLYVLGDWQDSMIPNVGFLTRFGEKHHYIYMTTEKGKEALRLYDEGMCHESI